MSLRYKIIAAIMVSAMISVAMATIPLVLGSRHIADDGATRALDQMQSKFEFALQARINEALSMAEIVAAIPRVQRAVENSDTKGLMRLFVKDFEAFSKRSGVLQFQFHTPQAVSILRVHEPDKYGDDLSAFRPMVVEANRLQTAFAGLERGRAGLGIRGISPIKDDGEHLGTVEIGLAFDSSFLQGILAGSDNAIELYLLPNSSVDTFDDADASITRITGQFEGAPLLDSAALKATLSGQGGARAITLEGEDYGTKSFVINDFAGDPVAIANIILPQARVQAIADDMMFRTLLGVAGALVLSGLLAWYFGRNLTSKLRQIISRMQRLSEGETRLNLSGLDNEKAEIAEMVQHLRVFRDGLYEAEQLRELNARAQQAQAHVVAQLADGLRKVAKGDLDAQIAGEFDNEYRALIDDYNVAVDRLTNVISAISSTADAVSHSADEITASAENLSTRTENSAATLEETAAALQQVTSAIQGSTEGARHADRSGQDAIQKARAGADIVAETVRAMTEIDHSAGEIARISGLIDDIAFQTNLLALNAGVEAARAGEAGSGFAVVAAEVRSLAQRTTEAARQIGALIATSGDRVQHGVSLVGETGASLDSIVSAIENVTAQIRRIAELSEEQAQGLGEVNIAVRHLDRVTQENAGMFEQTTAASAALQREGAQLAELVGNFSLPSGGNAVDQRASAA